MPTTLAELGLTRDGVPGLVRDALDDVVLQNSPVQPTPEQLTALVESLL
jgi:alcohol dehydrogenase class IV